MVSTARDRTLVRNAETLIDPVELVVFVSRILIDVFETRTIMIFLAGRSFFSGCPPPFTAMGGQQHIEIFIFVHNIILLPEIPPVIVARLEVLDANLFSNNETSYSPPNAQDCS